MPSPELSALVLTWQALSVFFDLLDESDDLKMSSSNNQTTQKIVAQEAEKLRSLWEAKGKGMAQAEFGETFSIGGQSAVANFLHGRSPLSLKAAVGFAKGLNTPIDAFSPRLAAQAREISEASRIDYSAVVRYDKSLPTPVSPPLVGTLSWDQERERVTYTDDPTGEHVSFWTSDDNAYAVRLVGDMFFPRYRSGEVLILSRHSPALPGVDALVILNDAAGTAYLRQWSTPNANMVSTLPLDGQGRPLTLRLVDMGLVQRVLGCVAPDLITQVNNTETSQDKH